MARDARNREYIGAIVWLEKAGVVNVCYCLNAPGFTLSTRPTLYMPSTNNTSTLSYYDTAVSYFVAFDLNLRRSTIRSPYLFPLIFFF